MNIILGPRSGEALPSTYYPFAGIGTPCSLAIDEDSGVLGIYREHSEGTLFIPLAYAITTDRFRLEAYSLTRFLEEADGFLSVTKK